MSTLVDFGPVKPSIQPYKNGYSVPLALRQVERPGIEEGTTETTWQGYLVEVSALTEYELDTALAQVPDDDDYSADKQAALEQAARMERIKTMEINPAILALEERAAEQDAVIGELRTRIVELEGLMARVAALEAG